MKTGTEAESIAPSVSPTVTAGAKQTIVVLKGRTIRYLGGGGGGARVFVACNFFFYLREKTNFFFGDQRPTIFFYVPSKKVFVVCFPYYVSLGVFSGQHIFHQFRKQTFFFCPHFQQTIFF